MISIIFLLSTAVLAQASPSNFNLWNRTRITGGSEAKDGEFPYMASIRDSRTNKHFCGGSILNEQSVLSAAHCFSEKRAKDIQILVGTNKQDSGGTTYPVQQIIIHKGFRRSTLENDIAILRISKNIEMSDKVQPISIADTDTAVGENLKFCGWGFLDYDDFELPNNLQKIITTLISLKDCKDYYENSPQVVSQYQLCTLLPAGKGICEGDSGSPVVNKDGKQVGLESNGPPCGYSVPDIHTNVKAYKKWISDNSGV